MSQLQATQADASIAARALKFCVRYQLTDGEMDTCRQVLDSFNMKARTLTSNHRRDLDGIAHRVYVYDTPPALRVVL